MARRFNIRGILRIGKAKILMKTTLVTLLRLDNPKPYGAPGHLSLIERRGLLFLPHFSLLP